METQQTHFDLGLGDPVATEPPTKIFEIWGETDDRVGMLQDDVIAWSFEGGVWWITAADQSITGYNVAKFVWLSIKLPEPL